MRRRTTAPATTDCARYFPTPSVTRTGTRRTRPHRRRRWSARPGPTHQAGHRPARSVRRRRRGRPSPGSCGDAVVIVCPLHVERVRKRRPLLGERFAVPPFGVIGNPSDFRLGIFFHIGRRGVVACLVVPRDARTGLDRESDGVEVVLVAVGDHRDSVRLVGHLRIAPWWRPSSPCRRR